MVSPTAANMALDGLEGRLQRRFKGRHKVNLVRFADDFVITGASRALLENEVKPLVVQFLAERGLELSEEKTRIVHIEQGFDFLGFNVRKYNGKLLIKPAKSSIAAVKEKVRDVFNSGISLPQDALIRRLNPIIRGWIQYYGAFQRSTLLSVLRHIDRHLVKWVKRKYLKRRRYFERAKRWLGRVARHQPGLFAHWRLARPFPG